MKCMDGIKKRSTDLRIINMSRMHLTRSLICMTLKTGRRPCPEWSDRRIFYNAHRTQRGVCDQRYCSGHILVASLLDWKRRIGNCRIGNWPDRTRFLKTAAVSKLIVVEQGLEQCSAWTLAVPWRSKSVKVDIQGGPIKTGLFLICNNVRQVWVPALPNMSNFSTFSKEYFAIEFMVGYLNILS